MTFAIWLTIYLVGAFLFAVFAVKDPESPDDVFKCIMLGLIWFVIVPILLVMVSVHYSARFVRWVGRCV